MRSDLVKQGVEHTPHRSLLKADGLTDEQMRRPLIGVVNSFAEVVPGHMHMEQIARAVKDGVLMAGGTPLEFNTIAVCDGIAMGHDGMHFSLSSRELIADTIECMATGHALDALVFCPNCDKIVPGMLLAAVRLNLPCVFVSGGPMLSIHERDLNTAFEAVGAYKAGLLDEAGVADVENSCCPTCGSCSGMFTANSMNSLCEVLGMALPGNGTIPAVYSARLRLAKEAGMRVMDVLNKNIRPRDIITADAIENALTTDMALGCSTNTALHLMAVAHEAGVPFDLHKINEISDKTPNLCHLAPAGHHHMQDLMEAGGIYAVIHELAEHGLIHEDCMTVLGKTIGEATKDAKVKNKDVIRPWDNPYLKEGGLAVLYGNLAPHGSIVKRSAVAPEMMVNECTARCFNSEEEAIGAIYSGKIKAGDCVVIRYEGPAGGPGMREMLSPTSAIAGMKLDTTVSLITDGRFSGASRGAAIGHISPEAQAGGPIAYIKDGDKIKIDIPHYSIELEVSDEEMAERKKTMKIREQRNLTGYLKKYAKLVHSADTGAIVE
jgi:dihydroxy-acid dehydratase